MRSIVTAVLLLLAGVGAPTLARATCVVDPTGTAGVPGAHASVNAALADPACAAAGSVIEVLCPTAGCTDTKVAVSGLSGITIRSMEATGGGPVTFAAAGGVPALSVSASTGIVLEGISRYQGGATAVAVDASEVSFVGPTTAAGQRYGQIVGGTGLLVSGASRVDLRWIGVTDSQTGLRLVPGAGGVPVVVAAGVALLDNVLAAEVVGPAIGCAGTSLMALELRGDFETAWLNYVMGNVEGFRVTGRARLAVDHTILASNIHQLAPGGLDPVLFSIVDSARLVARNVLVYNNDMIPGLTGPYAAGGAPAGYVLNHRSCDESIFVASTVVNNAADVVFGVDGSGRVTLDHTVVSGNWGKVLSMSNWYVTHGNTCPPVRSIASNLHGNRVNADPAVCLPLPGLGTAWNPMVTVSPTTPLELSSYPDVVAPPTDLYLIRRRQPGKFPLPPGLFVGRPWSVDGVHDDPRRLDEGYHNPM